jgi:Beta-lactamase enzyme family
VFAFRSIFAATGAALVGLASGATPAGAAHAPPAHGAASAPRTSGVLVTSIRQWEDSTGSWHVAGIVTNTLQASIDDVEVTLNLEDSSDSVLQTITTGSLIGVLDSGQSSPFLAVLAPPSGYTHAVATVQSWAIDSSGADNSLLATTSSTCSDQTISGTLQNTGPEIGGAEVAVEFLDSNNDLLDVSSIALTGTIRAGGAETFSVARAPGAPVCTHLKLVASAPIVFRTLTATTSGAGQGSVTLPAGTSCGPACVSAPIASSVNLDAIPGSRSTFSGWSGACRGVSPTCVVFMNDDETTDAAFAIATVVLRVELKGRGSIRSSPAGIACPQTCWHRFAIDTRVTLDIHSSRRWHLVGWGGRCGHVSKCPVVMTVGRTVRASIAPNTAPLWGSLRRFIRGRTSRVSVAIFDVRSGTSYLYAPAAHFDAASTAKVEILATALYRAQQRHRWLTPEERDEAIPMIEDSDNDAADALWSDVGDARSVQRFDDLVPMPDTTVSSAWGLTRVTAPDCVRLERQYVTPDSLLDRRSRSYGLHLMEHVTPSQGWGVSAGVPSRVTVALKNGWLPQPGTAWTINSIGWVDGDGRDYAIAVLTDQNSSMGYGISTIEGISRRVWAAL